MKWFKNGYPELYDMDEEFLVEVTWQEPKPETQEERNRDYYGWDVGTGIRWQCAYPEEDPSLPQNRPGQCVQQPCRRCGANTCMSSSSVH